MTAAVKAVSVGANDKKCIFYPSETEKKLDFYAVGDYISCDS